MCSQASDDKGWIWRVAISAKKRFPSRTSLQLAFFVCILPIHLWAWVWFFYKLPSYLLKLSVSQTMGVFAYAQVFALFEGLLLCGLAILAAFLLPGRLFRNYFLPQVVLLLLALTGWAIGLHLQGIDFAGAEAISAETRPFLYAWTSGWLALLLGLSVAMRYWTAMQRALAAFADRLIVLSGFFLLVDVLCVAIVLVRNL